MDTSRPEPDTRRAPVRRRIPADAEEEIRRLYREGVRSPREAKAKLDDLVKTGALNRDCLVSLKTIQRIYDELDKLDRSAPWTLGSWTGEPEPVLRVLSEMIRATEGGFQTISNSEANWVCRIYRAAPTIGPWFCYLLARLYIEREAEQQPTLDLDMYVSHTAWNWSSDYWLGVIGGLYPCAPEFLLTSRRSTPEDRLALQNLRNTMADVVASMDGVDIKTLLRTSTERLVSGYVVDGGGGMEAMTLAAMASVMIEVAQEASASTVVGGVVGFQSSLEERALALFDSRFPVAPITARGRVAAEIKRLVAADAAEESDAG